MGSSLWVVCYSQVPQVLRRHRHVNHDLQSQRFGDKQYPQALQESENNLDDSAILLLILNATPICEKLRVYTVKVLFQKLNLCKIKEIGEIHFWTRRVSPSK